MNSVGGERSSVKNPTTLPSSNAVYDKNDFPDAFDRDITRTNVGEEITITREVNNNRRKSQIPRPRRNWSLQDTRAFMFPCMFSYGSRRASRYYLCDIKYVFVYGARACLCV